MSQNTYSPDSWANFTPVDTAVGSLTQPFNPDKVAELVNAAMVSLGIGIPPVAYLGCGPEDTLISIGLPNPVTQPQIDAALAALNAICVDPTRNNLTAEQQAAADLAAELAAIQAKIEAMAADIIIDTGDPNAVPPTTGLKGTLTNANWNPLTNAQKIELLRTNQQAVINNQLDILRSVRYLLRQVKQDKTGVSTLAALR